MRAMTTSKDQDPAPVLAARDGRGRGAAWPAAVAAVTVVLLAVGCTSIVPMARPLAGRYEATHGQRVEALSAPPVQDYADANRIDLRQVERVLLPGVSVPPQENPGAPAVLISSTPYVSGRWTYFTSGSVRIFELLKVQVGGLPRPLLLVLYSRAAPAGVILDTFQAEWRCAVLDDEGRVRSDRPFTTRIPHREEGLWDTICTSLGIEKNQVVASIVYAHSGGGGGREQEFTARFSIAARPVCLALIEARQTLDKYEE